MADDALRLDAALVARGLVATRSRARDLVQRGFVRVDGRTADKPALGVRRVQHVEIAPEAPAHVSRGAEKLAAALAAFSLSPEGRVALDIGASTGGFTEVLLSRGATRVHAVDVGHGQLHPALRADPRVVALEDLDARDLTPALVPEPIGAITADVSFISLEKAMPAALALAVPGAWLVALIKPQFEVGPDYVARGGIVRDDAARDAAVLRIEAWLAAQPGWRVIGIMPSPILGGSGNTEYLMAGCYNG